MDNAGDVPEKIFRRKDEIVSRSIAGETILVPVMGKLADMQRIFSLNAVGEYVWKLLDGARGLDQIREEVARVFEVGRDEAERDIMEFIEELRKEELITEVR